IGAQLRFAVQIHVERADVEEREVQEFGRREVDVSEQGAGRDSFRIFVKLAKEIFDAHPPVPANDTWRDLVANRHRKDGRMVGELADAGGDLPPNLPPQTAVIQKGNVLGPGQPDHDAQAVVSRLVEQIATGGRVEADRVDAEARHQTEVFRDLTRRGKLAALRIRREGAVSNAFDQKTVADALPRSGTGAPEKFSVG